MESTENKQKFIEIYGQKLLTKLPGIEISEDGSLRMEFIALENLTQRTQNLSMLMDSAKSIMAEKGLDNLLTLIMQSVTEVMSADRSTLYLIDREKKQIWSRVAQGTSEIRIPLGQGIAGHVADSGKTVNIPDAYSDSRFNRDFDLKTGYHTKSILCMPVYDPRQNIIGAIQVLNKLDGTVFTKENEDLLAAFSSLAGISLSNAQAYEELQQERDLLEVRVKERTKDLEESRKKSDELLLNILPVSIADELKELGRAAPRRYESVSVMFTDFKGFTMVAEKKSPEELINDLDYCFNFFDGLIEKYNLEKIKTIGDAYMCAGGIPASNNSHPVEITLAGLELQRFMMETGNRKKMKGESFWELRLGIHTGPVVAGVVGKKKFAYDIWGDTVNTASRMESSGEPGKVNISSATYELIKEYFICNHRGQVAAKNKGKIDMYFIESIKPEYSIDGNGITPNSKLLEVISRLKGP
jgi:class 3 adenylate cyclase/putative methionine-R-sulfoxide reductase with GAF domain